MAPSLLEILAVVQAEAVADLMSNSGRDAACDGVTDFFFTNNQRTRSQRVTIT